MQCGIPIDCKEGSHLNWPTTETFLQKSPFPSPHLQPLFLINPLQPQPPLLSMWPFYTHPAPTPFPMTPLHSNIWTLIVLFKHLQVQNKSYTKRAFGCLLTVAQEPKKKKIKKEINEGERKEEVCVGGSSPLIPDVVWSCSGASLRERACPLVL